MLREMMFGKSNLGLIQRSLDAAMLRSRAISNNIANVNTPGFRRIEVSFEKQLRSALNRTSLKGVTTNNGHLRLGQQSLGQVTPVAYKPVDGTLSSGVNNVDIDSEMAKLAEAQIQYSYAIKFGQGIFKKMNSAIQQRSIPID